MIIYLLLKFIFMIIIIFLKKILLIKKNLLKKNHKKHSNKKGGQKNSPFKSSKGLMECISYLDGWGHILLLNFITIQEPIYT
jgi:hypothetical protein